MLLKNLKHKSQNHKYPSQISTRLTKVINILSYVNGYYGQFKVKLEQTVLRLDDAAREKVKTLIDVSKWTIQKFA